MREADCMQGGRAQPMEVLRVLHRLFEAHAPETLMALFGAATSMVLFYLVWALLRHLFGLQDRSEALEAGQDQATTALVESLVNALVIEAGHLRNTLDGILEESLRRSERNAQLLARLLSQSEETPGKVLELLKPEIDSLHQRLHQTEERIVAQVITPAEVPAQEDPPSPSDEPITGSD
jgi:hypothetical protein